MGCLKRREINGVDTKNKKGRTGTVAFDWSKVKQLRSLTDPGDRQQKFEHEFMVIYGHQIVIRSCNTIYCTTSKLNTLLIAKKIVKIIYKRLRLQVCTLLLS